MEEESLPCRIQRKALEMIVQDCSIVEVLDAILREVESSIDGLYCSVVALDEDGVHVHPLSAPSLPVGYSSALEGTCIGRDQGSCGAAMAIEQAVIVSDIATDPLWRPFHDLALSFGLRACWSVPIRMAGKPILGSFAMYYDRVAHPDVRSWRLIMGTMSLVALCLERERHRRQLQQSHHLLEVKVEARTEELTQALRSLRNTQEELLNREKMAALGMLVAGVAHELNTPIGNAILSTSFLCEGQKKLFSALQDGSLGRNQLDSALADANAALILVQRNLEKAADLIGHFKQMAVDQSSERRRQFLLHEVIADNLVTFRASVRGIDLHFEVDVAPDLLLDGYPGALGQVLTNLLVNARLHAFAGRDHGCIGLRAWASGDDVHFVCSDDGCGIEPGHLSRIFEPYFTTRPEAGGSGLGMAIVYNLIVHILGGRIEVRSQLGQGSEFVMVFPRVAPLHLP